MDTLGFIGFADGVAFNDSPATSGRVTIMTAFIFAGETRGARLVQRRVPTILVIDKTDFGEAVKGVELTIWIAGLADSFGALGLVGHDFGVQNRRTALALDAAYGGTIFN